MRLKLKGSKMKKLLVAGSVILFNFLYAWGGTSSKVVKEAMPKAQQSFLGLDNNLIKKLKYQAIFLLSINAIHHNKTKDALRYLQLAYKKAYYKMQQDNVLFWQYKLTNQEQYLKQLASSWDINIYSLYAKQKTKTNINNIIYSIDLPKTNKLQRYKYDVSNPFDWIKALSKIKKLNQKSIQYFQNLFGTSDKVGHLAFVLERYYGYKKSYFITPYEQILKRYHNVNKPLLYAIARQESRFIPSSISSAYAMGVMQIMPFLSKAIAKQLKEPYNIFDQLKAEKNLKYGNKHLNFLEVRLKNPLFIAYAYNAGIGFTKRILKTGLFKKSSKFEPYLSMELIPYDETRKYGKKVLANYFVYYNHFHKQHKISFTSLVDSIYIK